MSNFDIGVMKRIEALQPMPLPEPLNIVVTIPPEILDGPARVFRSEYLDAHPNSEALSDDDRDLVALAFLTLAYRLPITTYDLTKWISTCGGFDPVGVADYAVEALGLEPVETPLRRARHSKAT